MTTTPEALPLTADELADFYEWAAFVPVADKEPVANIWFRKALATIQSAHDEIARLINEVNTEKARADDLAMQLLGVRLQRDAEVAEVKATSQTLSAKLAVCVEALRPFVEAASHTRLFITSREKMHSDGVKLWDDDVARAADALKDLPQAAADLIERIKLMDTWIACSGIPNPPQS